MSLAESQHELGKIFFQENYQGQIERPILSSASQARCAHPYPPKKTCGNPTKSPYQQNPDIRRAHIPHPVFFR